MELLAERIVAGGAALAHDDQGRVVFIEGALPVSASVSRSPSNARILAGRGSSTSWIGPPTGSLRRASSWRSVVAAAGGSTSSRRPSGLSSAGSSSTRCDASPTSKTRTLSTGPLYWPPATARPCASPSSTGGPRSTSAPATVSLQSTRVSLHTRLSTSFFVTGVSMGPPKLCCGRVWPPANVLAWPRPASARLRLPADVAVGERVSVHEVVAGHRFRISARSFFQTRPDGAEALVQAVTDAAGPLAASDGHLVRDVTAVSGCTPRRWVRTGR